MKNSVILIFVLFLLGFVPGLTFSKTITVCQKCTISTVKEGIAQAEENDTVLVKAGIYRESNLLIKKPLTLIGENRPVIDGQHQGEIITIGADNVTLDGVTLKNVEISHTKDYAAVRLVKSKRFVIKNLILDKPFFGIYLQKSNRGKILNNTIKGEATSEFNSGNAIHLWYSHYNKIKGNSVENVRDGIYLEFSDHNEIEDNKSKHNVRYGLHFMMSKQDKVSRCILEDNGAGVAVMFSDYIDFFNNTFINNWGTAAYGLLLKELRDAKIENNLFFKNTVGITVEGSNRIDYHHNDFKSNGWAIKVKGGSYKNDFSRNNFLYNSFDLAYNGHLNDNTISHNYWSDYTGYDLDEDGIGDVPYRPVKLFSYIVGNTSEAIILLRSLFIDLLNFSEKVSPIFTPDNLRDDYPQMKKISHDRN